VWHASQKVTDQPDGGVRLTLRLSSLDEITDWILGWGPRAVARKPPELVQRLRETAIAMAKRYNDGQ